MVPTFVYRSFHDTSKLLAKTAEEHYRTAGGVERDLRRCLAEWEARGDINDFAAGQEDSPTGC